jgi:hypothetical protein
MKKAYHRIAGITIPGFPPPRGQAALQTIIGGIEFICIFYLEWEKKGLTYPEPFYMLFLIVISGIIRIVRDGL